jgi:hypothetical protein
MYQAAHSALNGVFGAAVVAPAIALARCKLGGGDARYAA